MANEPTNGTEFGTRLPPQSTESEAAILGALLLDNRAFDQIEGLIKADDFYVYAHRVIYQSISNLLGQAAGADVVTVFEHLKTAQHDEDIGGLKYLNTLAQFVPSSTNIKRYCEVIREKSILRSLLKAADQTATDIFNQQGRGAQDLLDEAERRVLAIGENGIRKTEVKTLDDQIFRAIDWIQNRADNPNEETGVRSGFIDLDRMIGGLEGGDLVVIAGRPSMGKTSLAMNIAEHAAIEQNLPVLVISLETQADQLTRRAIGSIGRINQTRIKNGALTDDEWARLTETAEKMRGHAMDILDDGSCSIFSIRAEARRAARRHKGLGLIVVDYLQLLEGGSDSTENRATEVGQISRGLKLLAKEMQCPIIALSQLNRGVENRTDKRPLMSDLRESGAIEQDADIIMFIYRDEYYTKEASKEPGVAEVIIGKQRNGPTGTVKLAWQSDYTRFANLANY